MIFFCFLSFLPLFLVCLHRINMQEFSAEGTKWFSPKSHWYLVNLAKCTKHKSWVLISAPLPIQLYIFFTRVSGWIWIKYQSFLIGFACFFFLYCCTPVHTCVFFLMLLHTSIFSFEKSLHSFERHELPRVLPSFYLHHLAVEGHASHSMYLSVTICFQLSRKAEPSSMCLTYLSHGHGRLQMLAESEKHWIPLNRHVAANWCSVDSLLRVRYGRPFIILPISLSCWSSLSLLELRDTQVSGQGESLRVKSSESICFFRGHCGNVTMKRKKGPSYSSTNSKHGLSNTCQSQTACDFTICGNLNKTNPMNKCNKMETVSENKQVLPEGDRVVGRR